MSRFTCLFTILLLWAAVGSCQVHREPNLLWFEAGSGGYVSTHESEGFCWSLSASLVREGNLYKARFIHLQELSFFGPTPFEQFISFGMMAGKGVTGDIAHLYLSGGVGIAGGSIRGDMLGISSSSRSFFDIWDPRQFEEEHFITPSIPVEVDFLLKFGKHFGPGITLFGDLNVKRPFCGATVNVKLGKVGSTGAGIGVRE